MASCPCPLLDKMELVDSSLLQWPVAQCARLIVWVWHIFEGVVSCCPLFRSEFVLESTRWELDFCPLSGNEKRPLLGGCVSTTIMLNPIRSMTLVRCREVVLFAEGPLSEARL